MLVTSASVAQPSWDKLLNLGVIDLPDGVYHVGQRLLRVNYPEFQHYEQFKTSGFSNQIHLILEPVSKGLGFTVLPSYAVSTFNDQQNIYVHHLPSAVNETLYVGVHRNRFIANRIKTVMAEVETYLNSGG